MHHTVANLGPCILAVRVMLKKTTHALVLKDQSVLPCKFPSWRLRPAVKCESQLPGMYETSSSEDQKQYIQCTSEQVNILWDPVSPWKSQETDRKEDIDLANMVYDHSVYCTEPSVETRPSCQTHTVQCMRHKVCFIFALHRCMTLPMTIRCISYPLWEIQHSSLAIYQE